MALREAFESAKRRQTSTRLPKRLTETVLPDHVVNEQHLLSELSNKEPTELANLLETLAISLGDAPNTPTHGSAPARRQRRR